jgi:hypothetical protein
VTGTSLVGFPQFAFVCYMVRSRYVKRGETASIINRMRRTDHEAKSCGCHGFSHDVGRVAVIALSSPLGG